MTTSATFTPPYPPSWIDRLLDWIGRLRMPNWLFYLGLTVVEVPLYSELNRIIDAGELERVDVLNRIANSLINERDIVHKIST